MIAQRETHHALERRSVLAQEGIEPDIMIAHRHDQLRVEPGDRGDLRHAVPEDGKLLRDARLMLPSDPGMLRNLGEVLDIPIQNQSAQRPVLSKPARQFDQGAVRGRGWLVAAIVTIAGYDDMTLINFERVSADDFGRSRRRDYGRQVNNRLVPHSAASHHAASLSSAAGRAVNANSPCSSSAASRYALSAASGDR